MAATKAEEPKVVDTKAEDTSKAPSKTSRNTPTGTRILPGGMLRGVRREASVLMDTVTGANVPIHDRLLDPLTNQAVEVIKEPITEEEAAEDLKVEVAALRGTSTGSSKASSKEK